LSGKLHNAWLSNISFNLLMLFMRHDFCRKYVFFKEPLAVKTLFAGGRLRPRLALFIFINQLVDCFGIILWDVSTVAEDHNFSLPGIPQAFYAWSILVLKLLLSSLVNYGGWWEYHTA